MVKWSSKWHKSSRTCWKCWRLSLLFYCNVISDKVYLWVMDRPSSVFYHFYTGENFRDSLLSLLYINTICCCCVVLSTAMVMTGWSVNLTTLFLGRLRPTKRLTSTQWTFFCKSLTTSLLESAEQTLFEKYSALKRFVLLDQFFP